MKKRQLTQKHRSYLYSTENIKKLSENSLKLKRTLNDKSKQVTPELGYIIGVLLGDGYINKRYISLHVKDIEFAKFFTDQFYKWCGVLPPTYEYNDNFEVKIGFTNACTFLRSLLSDFTWVNDSDIETKKMIVKGLWDSEGSINDSCIGFSLTNGEAAFLFKRLCDEIGIKNTFNKYGEFYFVRIFGRENKIMFLNKIGLTIERKKKKLLSQISKPQFYRRWTNEEKAYVTNNYLLYTANNLGKSIDRTNRSIYKFANKNNLKKIGI